MTFELIVKIVAEGFIFTPNAVVKDVGGAMTMFIYVVLHSPIIPFCKHIRPPVFYILLFMPHLFRQV